jgi:anti-sigma factor RsiW
MTCDSRDILLYLDGELSPEAAARVRLHAASCQRCHAVLEQQQRLDRALDDLDDFAAPEGFADRTVLRARCDVTRSVSSPIEVKRAAVFVASLAGAAALLLWPSGMLAPTVSALGPARCLSKFAFAWAANSCTGAFIVGRTLSAHLFAEAGLPLAPALALLGALVAIVAILVGRYHRTRSPREGHGRAW